MLAAVKAGRSGREAETHWGSGPADHKQLRIAGFVSSPRAIAEGGMSLYRRKPPKEDTKIRYRPHNDTALVEIGVDPDEKDKFLGNV